MTQDAKKGIIYVLTNEWMPGLVKIGKTKNSVDDRKNQLYSTGVPTQFECEYAVKVNNYEEVEKRILSAFQKYRVNIKREFFKIEADDVIAVLKAFELVGGSDVTNVINKDLKKNVSQEEVASIEGYHKRQSLPNFNFIEMGIMVGERLDFKDQEKGISVIVKGERIVEYNGEEMSLTKATKSILDNPSPVSPTLYWLYKGKKLRNIYLDTYTNIES